MSVEPGPYRLAPGPLLPAPPNPARRRWARRALGLALLGGVLGGLVLAHRPLLVGFAGLFRVDDPAPSDALVLLLGGPNHRPARAAELYRRGLAPIILLGTSGPILGASTETWYYRQQLIARGVPADAIRILPAEVTSTHDEAERVRDYARRHPLRRITVVTTSFHTARARWTFRKVLRELGIDVRAAAADHPRFREADWYRSEEGLVLYFGETIKSIYYRLAY
jgi:uncharacterized SAM-binding protein YcdF (DUF218 family)